MGVLIPVNYAMVALKFSVTGGRAPMFTTFGVNAGTNDAEEVALAVDDAVVDSSWFIAAAMFISYRLDSIVVTRMTSTGPLGFEHTVNRQGTIPTSLPTPNNCALLVRKVTSRGGRRGRGRMFVPPCSISDANVDGVGVIGTTQLVDQGTKAGNFKLALATNGVPMFLLHSHPDDAPDEVTSLSVQQLMATQRKRMRA